LERDFGGRTAICADRVIHFAIGVAGRFTVRAALFATDGLVLEPLLSIELLLAGRKDKLFTAILAYQCLVFEHLDFFPFSVHDFFDTRAPADLVFAPTPANWKGRYPAECLSLLLLSAHYAPVGLTTRPHHAHESFDSLTWIVLPATGFDFQPQTRFTDTKFIIEHVTW
jgi:hypothetical protein